MVKAVFLDIDGTFMDTNYLHIEAWAQAFEEVELGRRARVSTTRWAKAPTR